MIMKCQRSKFYLQRKHAYFNCAYMSPLMKKVEKAGIKGIKKKRTPFHIGINDFFQETENLRLLFSKLIDNDEPNRVVIIPSASYGLASVVNNIFDIKEKGEILIINEQFPSNVYAWEGLKEKGFDIKTISSTDSERRGESWNEKIIESISETTRVVAMAHVHWSDGTLFHLQKIRERLDKVNGFLVIDGTQSIGALPFSIKNIRPDALICSAYKWLMGPYSIGLAYYGSAFDQGKPIEENWINRVNSEDFGNLVNYQSDYRQQALRYEVGEHSNFILIPMLYRAIQQLLRWTPKNIQTYTHQLMNHAIAELQNMGYQIENELYRGNHLFGVRLPKAIDMNALDLAFKKNRVNVSFRGGGIRISPHVYNDEMDVKRLLKAMKEPLH